jgi:hypothetical protein
MKSRIKILSGISLLSLIFIAGSRRMPRGHQNLLS